MAKELIQEFAKAFCSPLHQTLCCRIKLIALHAPFPVLNYPLVFKNHCFALRENIYREDTQCAVRLYCLFQDFFSIGYSSQETMCINFCGILSAFGHMLVNCLV